MRHLSIALLLSAALLAACGDDEDEKSGDSTRSEATSTLGEPTARPYNTETLELTLVSNLERDAGPGDPKVERIHCSMEGEPAKGKTITCRAAGDERGVNGPVEVTFADESGAAYAYEARLSGGGGYSDVLQGSVSGK